MSNAISYIKEQISPALATWRQSKGSRITVGWMHAANPEAVSELLQTLEAKQKRIAELEEIKAAAEKLVRCKGRYHSEQNYRALAALFGVTITTITTERLREIAEDGFLAHGESKELARALLAARKAVPVAYNQVQRDMMKDIITRKLGGNLVGEKLVMDDIHAVTLALINAGFRTTPPAPADCEDCGDNPRVACGTCQRIYSTEGSK